MLDFRGFGLDIQVDHAGFSGFWVRCPSRSEPELHFDVGLPGTCLEKGVNNPTAVAVRRRAKAV